MVDALDDGPVLAAAIRHLGKPSLPGAAPRLLRALGSPDPGVRAAAVEVAAALGVSDASERVQELLADRDPGVRRAAASAAGTLGLKAAGGPLLELVRDPDPGVRRAGLDSLRLLRDPRALPLAVGALADRETQLPALACIAELGGPAQGEAVADLAKRSPTAEILPLAARILTDWGRRPALLPAERLGLDRAVADVQGVTGLLVRWQVLGPIPPEAAASLVARAGWPGPPFDAQPGDAARWRTLFATGTEARLRVQGGAAAEGALGVPGRRGLHAAPSRRPCSSWRPATARSASGRTASSSTSEPRSSRSSRIPTASRSTSVGGPTAWPSRSPTPLARPNSTCDFAAGVRASTTSGSSRWH